MVSPVEFTATPKPGPKIPPPIIGEISAGDPSGLNTRQCPPELGVPCLKLLVTQALLSLSNTVYAVPAIRKFMEPESFILIASVHWFGIGSTTPNSFILLKD